LSLFALILHVTLLQIAKDHDKMCHQGKKTIERTQEKQTNKTNKTMIEHAYMKNSRPEREE